MQHIANSRKIRNESARRRLMDRFLMRELSFRVDPPLPTVSMLKELPTSLVEKPEFYEIIWRRMRTYVKFGITMVEFNIRLTIEEALTSDKIREHVASVFVALKSPVKLHLCFGFLLQSRTTGEITYYYASCNVSSSTQISYIDSITELQAFQREIDIEDIAHSCMQNAELSDSDRIFLRVANINIKLFPFLDEILIG